MFSYVFTAKRSIYKGYHASPVMWILYLLLLYITILLHRGGCQNLLQYYSFERKMEGYNPFSALNKLKGFHFILFNADLCLRILSQIRKNVANTRF